MSEIYTVVKKLDNSEINIQFRFEGHGLSDFDISRENAMILVNQLLAELNKDDSTRSTQ